MNHLKATMRVYEAHLHQAYKPCIIGAIPSDTYGNAWWGSIKVVLDGYTTRFR